MSDFEWMVLALGLLILNIGWWELYYEINIKED
jgi:hypothetical protein